MRISDWSSDVCSSDLLLADSILEAAARKLTIHPHTLRYRLDKVAELTGRSTSDPQTKLEMLFALRLYRSLGPTAQASIRDRKRVVEGKSRSVRVDSGGGRIMKTKKKTKNIKQE